MNEISENELEQVSGGAGGYSPSTIYSRANAEIGSTIYGDTSEFVSYCVSGRHIRIGTTQTFMGWPRPAAPQPGDICTNSQYCGIYAGNGQMIYPSSAKGRVILGNMAGDMIIVRYGG